MAEWSVKGSIRDGGAEKNTPMPYVRLGQTGLLVSRAGFGLLPMGPAQLDLPVQAGAVLLTYALERGFNFFDTAQYYHSYAPLRRALTAWEAAAHPGFCGPPPVVCSKSLATDAAGMEGAIEEARQALDRDVIDIFLLHEVRSGQLPLRAGALQALVRARALGRVRAIGLSTHHVDVTLAAASLPELDVVFPLLNYAGLGIRQGGGEDASAGSAVNPATGDSPADVAAMLAAIRACRAAGKGVFTMKALGGGCLTGAYRRALDFVFGQPDVQAVMLGFGRRAEIDDLLSYLQGRMPPNYQPDIAHKRIHIEQDDCLGCGACRQACPAGAIYWNRAGLAEVDPARCLTCGYCAPACPVRAIVLY